MIGPKIPVELQHRDYIGPALRAGMALWQQRMTISIARPVGGQVERDAARVPGGTVVQHSRSGLIETSHCLSPRTSAAGDVPPVSFPAAPTSQARR